MENKLDATEAYGRKDTIIISGATPGITAGEDSNAVVIELLNNKIGVTIEPNISVSHRLQPKRPDRQGIIHPPNLYVKLVRRDTKRALIDACRNYNKLNRNEPNKIYVNEGLTPRRRAIMQSLLKMKKTHNVVTGVTSQDGEVIAFTAARETAANSSSTSAAGGARKRDVRHRVNTREDLRKFAAEFLQKPLEDFLTTWPNL